MSEKSVSEQDITCVCSVCEIYDICHEPMKSNVVECCIYYKGKIPKGYIFHNRYVKKFHPQNWKYYVGYVYEFQCAKKYWLEEWEIKKENKGFFDNE